MDRRRLFVATLALTVLVAGSAGAYSSGGARPRAFTPSLAQATFVISGRGWGHGVGMCQWCAKTMADHGHTAEDIVTFFYPGAVLSTLPSP